MQGSIGLSFWTRVAETHKMDSVQKEEILPLFF